jgi:hypothetical protein
MKVKFGKLDVTVILLLTIVLALSSAIPNAPVFGDYGIIGPPLPAVTVTPSVPTAGVPFTLSGIIGGPASLTIYYNGTCSGAFFFARSIGPGQYNLRVPGQPAGVYSAEQSGSACVPFKITINGVPPPT